MRARVPLLPDRLRWAGVLAVAVVLVYFSLLDTPTITPPEPGAFWDKKLHLAGYAVFAFSLAYATARREIPRFNRVLLVIGVAVGFGIVIELIQWPLPNRYFSGLDILANVLGTLIATGWVVIEDRIDYIPVRL